jgi:F-type H+-transporting ATPase subunit delta
VGGDEVGGGMKETQVAERYARALYLALQENPSASSETVQKGLSRLAMALSADERLKASLGNPLLGAEKKKMLIAKSLNPGADASSRQVESSTRILSNFLELLVAKKRMDLLPLIIARFEQALESSKGTMKAHVKSASALNENSKKRIEEELSRIFKKKIFVEASVNPELLAGVVVKAGDVVIDNSLESQLKNMREKLGKS